MNNKTTNHTDNRTTLEGLKADIRAQTAALGKITMTAEIALLVLLKQYRDLVEQIISGTPFDANHLVAKIEQHNLMSKKKSGTIIIDRQLEEVFVQCGKYGSIIDFICHLLLAGQIPFGRYGLDIPEYQIRNCLSEQAQLPNSQLDNGNNDTSEIKIEFCIDLTGLDGAGEPMFFGREAEMNRLITILMCKKKRNALLLGEAGVGKTAIVEALAQRIIKGNVPPELAACKVLSLNLSSLLGGASGRGDFEERVKNLIQELEEHKQPIILFIDEFHAIAGMGNEGNFDLANLLKPMLARNKLCCIGATTYREYRIYIEKDGALIRRFQNIQIAEPSTEETVQMLHYLKENYEVYHGIRYEVEALAACVELTDQYVTNRRLPDKALDIMDEAGVEARRNQQKSVTVEMIKALITRNYHVPLSYQEELNNSQRSQLDRLFSQIIGYKREKERLKKLLFMAQTIMEETDTENCALMFAGNSDLGSMKLIQAVRKALFPIAEAYLELDLSGFQEKHMLSMLIGAPPGYIGSQESGILLDKLKKYPRILLVLRNIEAAHPQIIDYLNKTISGSMVIDTYGNQIRMKNTLTIIDNCGRDTIGQSGLDEHIFGTVEFYHLDKKELRELAEEYLSKMCNKVNKQKINLVFDQSLDEWLNRCVQNFHSEKELRKYLYEKTMDTLYEISNCKSINNKFIELYQTENSLKFKIVEDVEL